MTDESSKSPKFTVSISQLAREKLLHLHQEQDAIGRGHLFVDAYREIVRGLQHDPSVFGEELYRLPALCLQVRQAAIRPIVVDYGVHEEKQIVLVRGFKALF